MVFLDGIMGWSHQTVIASASLVAQLQLTGRASCMKFRRSVHSKKHPVSSAALEIQAARGVTGLLTPSECADVFGADKIPDWAHPDSAKKGDDRFASRCGCPWLHSSGAYLPAPNERVSQAEKERVETEALRQLCWRECQSSHKVLAAGAPAQECEGSEILSSMATVIFYDKFVLGRCLFKTKECDLRGARQGTGSGSRRNSITLLPTAALPPTHAARGVLQTYMLAQILRIYQRQHCCAFEHLDGAMSGVPEHLCVELKIFKWKSPNGDTFDELTGLPIASLSSGPYRETAHVPAVDIAHLQVAIAGETSSSPQCAIRPLGSLPPGNVLVIPLCRQGPLAIARDGSKCDGKCKFFTFCEIYIMSATEMTASICLLLCQALPHPFTTSTLKLELPLNGNLSLVPSLHALAQLSDASEESGRSRQRCAH